MDIIEITLSVDGLKAAVTVWTYDDAIAATDNIDIRGLSTEIAGGFVGCTVGMYAVTTGVDRGDCDRAYFKSFTYRGRA
jgi:alpha-N-arabinofuranosidase